jgi:hypothetical protein
VIVIEIQKHENPISRGIEGPAIGTKLGGQLIEKALSPWVRTIRRVLREPPLPSVLNDFERVLRQKAREPAL